MQCAQSVIWTTVIQQFNIIPLSYFDSGLIVVAYCNFSDIMFCACYYYYLIFSLKLFFDASELSYCKLIRVMALVQRVADFLKVPPALK